MFCHILFHNGFVSIRDLLGQINLRNNYFRSLVNMPELDIRREDYRLKFDEKRKLLNDLITFEN